jgi:putative ABC transport system substrate-binding protein
MSLAGLGLLSGCGFLPPQSRAPEPIRLIGVLGDSPSAHWDAFWDEMRGLGWAEGRNLMVESRWSEGDPQRYRGLADELVARNVDVLVAYGSNASAAAKQATVTLPIVAILVSGEAIELGIVDNIARPGGNITGMAGVSGTQLEGKQLQLLKEAVPLASRVAVLTLRPGPTTAPGSAARERALREAAVGLGLELHIVPVLGLDGLDEGFAAMAAAGDHAVKILTNPQFDLAWGRIAELALRHRLPAITENHEFARAGGLLAYGQGRSEVYRSASPYVDKILRGAHPGDLPMERPTEFDFVVNLKTAQALGLTIPKSILPQATEIIQ